MRSAFFRAALFFALTGSAPVWAAENICVDAFSASGAAASRPSGGTLEWKADEISTHDDVSVRRKTGIFTSRGAATTGLKMAFEISRAKHRPPVERPMTAILLHGVGDTRKSLNALKLEMEAQGWDVLSMDLLGHGETAELNTQAMDIAGQPIDYLKQVMLVSDLSQKLGIKKAVVVGHSMGGGLSMSVATELKQRSVEVVANIPVAPYLSAIDRFLITQANSPEVMNYISQQVMDKLSLGGWTGVQNAMKKTPIMGGFIYTAAEQYMRFWQALLQPALTVKLIAADSSIAKGIQHDFQLLSDPAIKSSIADMFRKYEDLKNAALPEAERSSAEQINLFVDGAVEATLGMRAMDFLSRVNPTPRDASIPTLLLYGSDDKIVIEPQVNDFMRESAARGDNVTFVKLESDHFIPQRFPKALMSLILKFMAENPNPQPETASKP